MALIRVWKERKELSPHRPKRVHTAWLAAGLAVVLLVIWLLGRV